MLENELVHTNTKPESVLIERIQSRYGDILTKTQLIVGLANTVFVGDAGNNLV